MARARTLRRPEKGRRTRNFKGYVYPGTGPNLAGPPPVAMIEAVPPSSPSTAPQPSSCSTRYASEARIREVVTQALELKLEGKSRAEQAAAIGIKPGTLTDYMVKAGKEGWLVTADVREHLECTTVHKIVRNIDRALDEMAGLGVQQQEMTIEAAKGLGLFKKHEVVQNDALPALTALTIKIEQPEGPQELAVGTGGGVGAYSEGETD